jgi:hypothetical protein
MADLGAAYSGRQYVSGNLLQICLWILTTLQTRYMYITNYEHT